jgi:hypothetical protein
MRAALVAAALSLALGGASGTAAQAGERHALVIGNGAYAHGRLGSPPHDARVMAGALGEAGFAVVLLEDATQAAMQRAIRRFGDDLARGGVGLFYYAGHGVQAKGRNYLIPVNAEIERGYELEFGAIDVNLVLAMMNAAGNPLNIVILDACHDNPFTRDFPSRQPGLAQMDAPAGTFIALAAAPGSVAAGGAGGNGAYTRHLVAEMRKPGVPIELMFKQVRNGVMADTGGRQIPWESSSLRGEFAFRPGATPGVAEAVAEAVQREREARRPELEKLQAALERQRKQLVALGLRPVAAAPSAPAGRLPRPGDSWTYRLSEAQRVDGPKQRRYTVKVSAASELGILDDYAVELERPGEWAHTPGAYVAALGRSLFAPYLGVLGELPASGALTRVAIVDPACSGGFLCEASARIAGREAVKVPAGTFDAVKVVVEHSWRPMAGGAGYSGATFFGSRTLTVWYAPAAKRAVKFSSRLNSGNVLPLDAEFELELVSYQLR